MTIYTSGSSTPPRNLHLDPNLFIVLRALCTYAPENKPKQASTTRIAKSSTHKEIQCSNQ